MKPYDDHLRASKHSNIKARKEYIRERRWSEEDWYAAWNAGLAAEIEIAQVSGGVK